MKYSIDYVALGVVAFAASIVRGIVKPDRRGLAGFLSAIAVGICCGMIAAVVAGEFGASVAWQYLFAALFAIFGDRFVYAALATMTGEAKQNIHVSGGQNVIGNNEGGVNQTECSDE